MHSQSKLAALPCSVGRRCVTTEGPLQTQWDLHPGQCWFLSLGDWPQGSSAVTPVSDAPQKGQVAIVILLGHSRLLSGFSAPLLVPHDLPEELHLLIRQ